MLYMNYTSSKQNSYLYLCFTKIFIFEFILGWIYSNLQSTFSW